MINLADFFYYYDDKNPNHRQAIALLEESLPTALTTDNSPWVKLYRTALLAPPPREENAVSVAASEAVRQNSYTGVIDWKNPRCFVSKYFTVAEVTQNDRRRIPRSGSGEERNIFRLAKELDKVRSAWGSAIGVTSWFRPGANYPVNINALVGGVRNSKHIEGLAVDVFPLNRKFAEFEQWLDNEAWENRALGYGVRSGKGFTHLDLRASRIRWWY